MRIQGTVRNARLVSALGAFFGAVLLGLGALFLEEGGLVAILWVLGAGAITAVHALNLFRRGGLAHAVVDLPELAPRPDLATRLRELDAAKGARLVTDAEYEGSRQRILASA